MSDSMDEKPTSTKMSAATVGVAGAVGGSTLSLMAWAFSMFGTVKGDISRVDATQAAQRETISQINARLDRTDLSLAGLQQKVERCVTLLEQMESRRRTDTASK